MFNLKTKKVLSTLLLGAFVFGLPTSAFAQEPSYSGALPAHMVTINGQVLDSTYMNYPLLVYKDITYLPLTDVVKKQFGLEQSFYQEPYVANGEPVWFVGLADREEAVWEFDTHRLTNQHRYDVQVLEGMVALNTIFSRDFYDNQLASYPLLQYRDIVYLPLTYDIAADGLGWDYAYDEQNGSFIDTTDPIRPQFQSDIIPRRSPQAWVHYQQYAYYPDGYLGYPNGTFGSRSWHLDYKQKGQPVQVVDISESLVTVMKDDLEFKALFDDNNQQVLPRLVDGQAYIFCVDKSDNQNLLLTVDMQTAEVTLTPYVIADNYGFK